MSLSGLLLFLFLDDLGSPRLRRKEQKRQRKEGKTVPAEKTHQENREADKEDSQTKETNGQTQKSTRLKINSRSRGTCKNIHCFIARTVNTKNILEILSFIVCNYEAFLMPQLLPQLFYLNS